MTSLHNEYVIGEIAALRAMGFEKEAMEMEKEAGILSLGLKLGGNALKSGASRIARGAGFAANKAARAFSPGSTKFGLGQVKRSTDNIANLAASSKSAKRVHAFGNIKQQALRRQAANLSPMKNSTLQSNAAKSRINVPTKPEPSVSSLKNAPGKTPDPVPDRFASQSSANLGNAPASNTLNKGTRLEGPELPPEVPPNFVSKKGARLEGPELPPSLPTAQSKTFDWMQKNPVLAGAGGLMGYKALSNKNDNIVIGR